MDREPSTDLGEKLLAVYPSLVSRSSDKKSVGENLELKGASRLPNTVRRRYLDEKVWSWNDCKRPREKEILCIILRITLRIISWIVTRRLITIVRVNVEFVSVECNWKFPVTVSTISSMGDETDRVERGTIRIDGDNFVTRG